MGYNLSTIFSLVRSHLRKLFLELLNLVWGDIALHGAMKRFVLQWLCAGIHLSANESLSAIILQCHRFRMNLSCNMFALLIRTPNGSWSGEGCSVLDGSSLETTVCSCNHLTNFAVLMQFTSVKVRICFIMVKTGETPPFSCKSTTVTHPYSLDNDFLWPEEMPNEKWHLLNGK